MEISTILLFLVLLLLAAFFSGTEVALMSLQLHKIESLIKERKFGATILKNLKKNIDKLLITILIGNTFAITITSSLATNIAIHIAPKTGLGESLTITIATILSTFFILLFGEIIPKSYGAKNPDKLGLFAAYPYKILITIFSPIIIVFEILIRLFTGKAHKVHMSDEELESFIDMGKAVGTIDEAEHEKLLGVLDLDDMTAEYIMTPRVDIIALNDKSTVREAIQFYTQNTHSRIPIYKDSIDKIYSFVTIRDLLSEKEKGGDEQKLSGLHFHKSLKIPLNQPLDRLLELFQKNNKHMAIVIDEYGGVAGLITLEDIIEEVFGDIRDETDKEIDEIKEIAENTLSIDSTAMIDDVLEEFDLELYHIGLDVQEFSSETVSYVLTDKLERFPHTGEVIHFPITVFDERSKEYSGIDFKISDIQEGKIGRIEVVIYKSLKPQTKQSSTSKK